MSNLNPYSIPEGIPVTFQGNQVYRIHPPLTSQLNNDQTNLPILNNNTTYYNNPNTYLANQNTQSTLYITHNQGIVNQQDLTDVMSVLKSGTTFIVCPYCKNHGPTISKRTISCPNLTCCVLFGFGGWICHQALKKKDINCYDSNHFCQTCGNKVGEYKACC